MVGSKADAHTRASAPLSERMRPKSLSEVVGQAHLLGPGSVLEGAAARDRMPSLILWGPPGTGKTTIARALAHQSEAVFAPFSAVLSGVAELRKLLAAAEQRLAEGTRTMLFVDEIHRFNKGQQDALLPHVERGIVTLIGATTENPSFAVNAALLSRAQVFRLEPLDKDALGSLLERALHDRERGLGELSLSAEPGGLELLAELADGDARRALDLLDLAATLVEPGGELTRVVAAQSARQPPLRYDRDGEEHYNVVSAFIKSMRGNDPDAAIYWMMRMVDGGEDPRFILRRMLIFASEDVGNADPGALRLAVAADAAFTRLGMPEGLFAMAQCCTYLASTVKSTASYQAWTAARAAIKKHGALPVPMKLRNAPTAAMKSWGYGEGYRYPPAHGGHVEGETHLPAALEGERYYRPAAVGFEAKLAARLKRLRSDGDDD